MKRDGIDFMSLGNKNTKHDIDWEKFRPVDKPLSVLVRVYRSTTDEVMVISLD
jgi:hypothetical protein